MLVGARFVARVAPAGVATWLIACGGPAQHPRPIPFAPLGPSAVVDPCTRPIAPEVSSALAARPAVPHCEELVTSRAVRVLLGGRELVAWHTIDARGSVIDEPPLWSTAILVDGNRESPDVGTIVISKFAQRRTVDAVRAQRLAQAFLLALGMPHQLTETAAAVQAAHRISEARAAIEANPPGIASTGEGHFQVRVWVVDRDDSGCDRAQGMTVHVSRYEISLVEGHPHEPPPLLYVQCR